MGGKKRTDE
jgi:hypothetical protein